MTNLTARNMHHLAPLMVAEFKKYGYQRPSRNGNVTRLPGITNVTLTSPHEKVCFFESRDANPFFHLIEAMAMLAGKNSAPLMSFLVKGMGDFSDDGLRFNSFYGERARVTWGDQIASVIAELKRDPDSRQAVVNLSNPMDLLQQTKDKACNLCMIFSVEHGQVNMTTFNRSNDCVWGFLTGANMVHFPFFQEYVAAKLGLTVGFWFHASANMHVYEWNDKWQGLVTELEEYRDGEYFDPYMAGSTDPLLLMSNECEVENFDSAVFNLLEQMGGVAASLRLECGHPVVSRAGVVIVAPRYCPSFLCNVVLPAWNAFVAYKLCRVHKTTDRVANESAHHFLSMMLACDWKDACTAWIDRRTLV